MSSSKRRPAMERGSALVIVLITILVAAGLAVALVVTATSRSRGSEARIRLEQALAIAEAGLDRGIAEANMPANRNNSAFPVATGSKISDANSVVLNDNGSQVGTFSCTLWPGDSDGADNDGDGLIDGADTDEDIYVIVVSEGYAGTGDSTGVNARVRAQIVKQTAQFGINSAVFIDDPTPNLALGSGASWKLSGDDHDMVSGAKIGGAPKLPAIATSGTFDATDTAAIISNSKLDDPGMAPGERFGLEGLETGSIGGGFGMFGLGATMRGYSGGTFFRRMPDPNVMAPMPLAFGTTSKTSTGKTSTGSTGQITGTTPTYQNGVAGYDMDDFVDWAKANAPSSNIVKGTGVTSTGPFGSPPTAASAGDWQITYHDAGGPGNAVKFTGGAPDGAGIWVIDGDLDMAGNMTYTGIIIVTGTVYFRGGGGTKMVKGAIISGEAALDNVDVNGTIDLLYSSGAVTNAANAFARYVMVSWEQID